MPTCHRCNTPNLTSAELRKTPRGHVHKDAVRCERIQRQLRVDAQTRRWLDTLEVEWTSLDDAYGSRDVINVLRTLARFSEAYSSLVVATVQSIAKHNGKHYTQKQIAKALDVPPSTLRGLKQSVR